MTEPHQPTGPTDAPAAAAPAQPAPAQPAPAQPAPAQAAPVAARATALEPASQPADLVAVMADDGPPIDAGDAKLFGVIDRLAAILDHSDLLELEIHVGETGLTLRKPAALAQPVVGPALAAAPGTSGAAADDVGPTAPGGGAGTAALPPARPSVKAPLTGIWYGSPAPGSAPYVQAGSEVAVGTVIGLIEAMKLFNEIKSDLAGRVVKVNAETGKLVKAKQPLIEVEPL